MATSVSHLTKFPTAGSLVTTGVFFPEDKILVTGHENGVVVSWELESGKYRILYACSSKVQTITCSKRKELLVGSHAGHVVVLKLDGGFTVIRPPTFSVHSRVWKSIWLHDDAFMVSSTYGDLGIFERDAKGNWSEKKLHGHSDSVFGIGLSKKGLLATGDYFGNILVWSRDNGEYKVVHRIKVLGAIEDIAWSCDDSFAAISQLGMIYLFERTKPEEMSWNLISEIGNATSTGNCVHISQDGKTVFGGTFTETIQFDTESLQANSIKIPGVRRIFSAGDKIFVLTSYGLSRFTRKAIEVSPRLIKYKYIKIGLVGHTGVGKSTLCNFLTIGSPGDVESTLGKKVWTWELPKDDDLQKRIVLVDHGGQETVLGTFLPFLLDSDMILILFQQNDLTTFNKALEIYDSLQQRRVDKTKIFFVQTHIDQKIAEFNEGLINSLVNDGKIIDNLKVCPKDGQGVMELKRKLLKHISWSNARTMVQSTYSHGVFQTILRLQEKNASTISLQEFAGKYKQITGSGIPKSHLKFLLNDYTNQGIVEYNSDVLDLIIFNEPEYNKLKTEIPIFVMKKNGLVSVEELCEEFKDSKFLAVIDAMYIRYKIAIDNFGHRIFPELLSETPIRIPSNLLELLKEASKATKCVADQKLNITNLIAALSELKLQCIGISKHDGLFSWEKNAVIYYSFERIGDVVEGFSICCNYRIGGKNEQIQSRLKLEFQNILEKLYGPSVEQKAEQNKKKVDSVRKIIYDACISYAGEQSDYAQRIFDNLRSKGITVFFDKFYEGKLWGRDLSEYFMNVYYKQSKYCIMLISKEYVSKAWPTHERRSAIARNIEEMGEYILPVRFDKSEVPGLPPTIKYLDATKKGPEEIAALFIGKLQGSDKEEQAKV
jgi:GTPase SAR1 family protein